MGVRRCSYISGVAIGDNLATGRYMKSPRGLRLHTWYVLGALTLIFKLLLVITLLVCLGCAGGNFNHIPKKPEVAREKVFHNKQIWSGACHKARVRRAREILLEGVGSPWVALYYMRCLDREVKQTLKYRREGVKEY